MAYLKRSTKLLQVFYPGLVWEIPTSLNEVFITFDDGPHPSVTPWVLDVLEKYNAVATFFCIGKNVVNHPALFEKVISQHAVGNHTMHHAKGWKTNTLNYIQEVKEAAIYIESNLFRPPYGKIKSSQIRELKKLNYRIIMWSHLSGDFDLKSTSRKSFEKWIDTIQPGAIITFHDSQKAFPKLKWMLPLVLEKLAHKGFLFSRLSQ